MAKKAPAKPAAKRKPRNAIVDNAPQIAELARRMEAERDRIIAEMAAEEEAKKKPVDGSPVIPDSVVWDVDADVFKIGKDAEIKLYDFEQALKNQLAELGYKKEPQKSSSPWRRFMLVGAAVAGLAVSFLGGGWSAGGWQIGPNAPVFTDSLAESHKNDRASQIRILREYAGKTFASEPEAQKWLNEQRIASRPDDWGPYTDELGVAADAGPDAIKAFADKLEGKR